MTRAVIAAALICGSGATMAKERSGMVETIRKLATLVSATQKAIDLAKKVGKIEKDWGGNLNVEIAPSDRRFSHASITRRPDSDDIASDLEVKLTPKSGLRLAQLTAAFGPHGKPVPMEHYDDPDAVQWLLHGVGPRGVQINVELEGRHRDLEDAPVAAVSFAAFDEH
jgi:hypothetical protein